MLSYVKLSYANSELMFSSPVMSLIASIFANIFQFIFLPMSVLLSFLFLRKLIVDNHLKIFNVLGGGLICYRRHFDSKR